MSDLVNKKCYLDAELIDASILVMALLIMMIALVDNLYAKMLSYFAAIFQTCFCYNVAINYDPSSLSIFVSQILVVLIAVKLNIEV